MPDDVIDAILDAQADVVVSAQQAKARAYGVHRTGLLIKSIKKGSTKRAKDGSRTLFVAPHGSRKRGKTTTTNAEIAFLNEYGKRGVKARPFMRDANEESAEATTAAGRAVYDAWLESKGL